MQDHLDERSDSYSRSYLKWAERLLVAAGVVMLTAWVLLSIDARVAQHAARQSLETAFHHQMPAHPRETDETPAATVEAPAVLRGSAVAALSIPRIQLSAVVLQGSDVRTLHRGPGHLENTALPGEAGNAVIAGHRDSFFRPLRNIRLGDDIFVDTVEGRFQYRVMSLRVVKPSDLSVLEPTDEATLTLITCYPFWVLGDAPDRFIVRAARVGNVMPTVGAALTAPAPDPDGVLSEEPLRQSVLASTPRAKWSDETLVRRAVESYRLTYNGRLSSHNDVGAAPLVFERCDVAVVDDQAEAVCGSSSSSAAEEEVSGRTFSLERVARGWAVRSIAIR